MILIFTLLAVVAGLGLIAAWIGENPGTVTMVWMDYQIETTVSVLVLAAFLLMLLVTLCYHFLRRIAFIPWSYTTHRNLKHYRIGLNEITYSVAALAASDIQSATLHTRKAEKVLGITPLTLMLRAQISKSEGNDEKSRQLLEQLLEHPQTEYLAAKSLADVAQKQQQLPQALNLAKRAHRVNPKDTQSAWSVFNLHITSGNIQDAHTHALEAKKSKSFSRSDFTSALGQIALRQAENSYANGHKENALVFARQAVKALPGDLKAVELCVRMYNEANQPNAALALIQKQWKTTPSDLLAEQFHLATDEMKTAKKEKLIAKLQASNGAAPENVLLEKNY